MKTNLSAILLSLLLLQGCQSAAPDAPPDHALAPQVPSPAMPAVNLPSIPSHTVNMLSFGAVGDGQTDNTRAFAAAIDACAAAGGGHVVVPAGTFLTGPITLKSRIDLHLESGSVVLFSKNRSDYPLVKTNYEGQETILCTSPLSGDQLHDVSITGPGAIDGQGQVWRPVKQSKLTDQQWQSLVSSGGFVDPKTQTWFPSKIWLSGEKRLATLRAGGESPIIEKFEPYHDLLRPPLLFLSNVQNLLLDGPTFRNSPSWNLHLLYDQDVTVRNVTIFNPYYAQNGDGIDIDSCRDVLLTQSRISAGDDVVCLKSGRDAQGRKVGRPTENVVISHCILGHGHGGIAIGSEMSGGVRNVEAFDCTLDGTDDALRFKTVRGRGGVVSNIRIHDIEMRNIQNACIGVDMYYQLKRSPAPTRRHGAGPEAPATQPDVSVAKPLVVTQEPAAPLGPGTPQFRDITISNIVCHGANIAMQLRGLPELPLLNVTIENASIVAKQGGAIIDADHITLRDVQIHSASVPCLQIQNARHLQLDNVDCVPQTIR